MFDKAFTSEEEIDSAYEAHINSLMLSGLPFDKSGLLIEWAHALRNFRESKTNPPWLS